MPLYALDGIEPSLPPLGEFWVAPDAQLVGRVRLGAEASVWFGAVLRGDNEEIFVGPGSNVQDLSMLHTDPGFPLTIGRDCTIGHRAMLHGCVIGDETLVGMGATLLNGARVGRNCLIGAGALILEGKTFPDNSLIVGAPARAVRELDADAAARLRRSARHYVANWRRYAAGLVAVQSS
ncbi:gamma carbonic anhydrase family protein [Methylocella sp.]|uniref:gamma carbonic anhydrase family protein n=1 Tax=Methylocella sp. TaxID=1978226 RepID=UPI0037833A35